MTFQSCSISSSIYLVSGVAEGGKITSLPVRVYKRSVSANESIIN